MQEKRIADLVTEAGRSAHLIRNYVQGYVNLNFPEMLSLDNISGRIEGVIRQIKSKIQEKTQNYSEDVDRVLFSTKFLLKINEGRPVNENFDRSITPRIKKCLSLIFINMSNVQIMLQNQINNTRKPLLKDNQSLNRSVWNCFNASSYLQNNNFKINADFRQKKERCHLLAQYSSNGAHLLQDMVSSY